MSILSASILHNGLASSGEVSASRGIGCKICDARARGCCMDCNKSILEMVGEFFRDAAVLIGVFAPVYRILREQALTRSWVVPIIGTVLILLTAGIALERVRK